MHFLAALWALALIWSRVCAVPHDDDDSSCSNSITISSQSDADRLGNCDTFNGNVTISSSASGVIHLNDVNEIRGSLTSTQGSNLTQLIAPDLDTIHGLLKLEQMDSLVNITLDSLQQVSGGITVTGNPNLQYLTFQDLKDVYGALELTGPFVSISLPSLDEVDGPTNIRGGGKMSCGPLDTLQSQGVYRGGYHCSSGGSSGLSPGAKGGIAAGAVVAVLLIMFLIWWVLRRRQQRLKHQQGHDHPNGPAPFAVPRVADQEKSTRYQTVPTEEHRSLSPEEPPSPEQAVSLHELFLPSHQARIVDAPATDAHPASLLPGQPIPNLERRLSLPHDRPGPIYNHRLSLPPYPVPVHERQSSVARKPLSPPPAQLDGNSIYEAANPASPAAEYHELDGGPVSGRHQQPIHAET